MKPVVLDGSTLEGGGQLVRVALALSAITGIPVSIHSIRANRAPHRRGKSSNHKSGNHVSTKVEGGLKESHLAALQYLAHQCDAFVEGAEVGSREITFVPGEGYAAQRKSKKHSKDLVDFDRNVVELQNPGSVWLIVQAILPYLIFRKPRAGEDLKAVELTIRGGTNVSKSMSGEYVQFVLLPVLQRIGLPAVEVEIVKRGWAGNAPAIGEVKLRVPPVPVTGFELAGFNIVDRGELESVTVKILAGSTEARDFLRAQIKRALIEALGEDISIHFEADEDSGDPRRLYILLVARTKNGWLLSRDFLGSGRSPKNASEERKILEQACQAVARDLVRELNHGGCVDEFLQDQLIIFQALAKGLSQIEGTDAQLPKAHDEQELTLHSQTVRWVCLEILNKLKDNVEFEDRGRCRGLGWNHTSSADAADSAAVHMARLGTE